MREHQAKHRQLAKERSKIERRKAMRLEHGTALLVCEGRRTEPHYLRELLRLLEISPARVEIIEGQTNADAMSVVRRARQLYERKPEYDHVFIIIDAEQANLQKALADCNQPIQRASIKKGIQEIHIRPIVTAPCFEYWLLLHFRYTDQPFISYADVLTELLVFLPDYKKVDPYIFDKVGGEEGLRRAVTNSAISKRELARTGATYPDTDMPILLEALETIR
jgi:hypothetical protein